jgi:hypothetical protein
MRIYLSGSLIFRTHSSSDGTLKGTRTWNGEKETASGQATNSGRASHRFTKAMENASGNGWGRCPEALSVLQMAVVRGLKWSPVLGLGPSLLYHFPLPSAQVTCLCPFCLGAPCCLWSGRSSWSTLAQHETGPLLGLTQEDNLRRPRREELFLHLCTVVLSTNSKLKIWSH